MAEAAAEAGGDEGGEGMGNTPCSSVPRTSATSTSASDHAPIPCRRSTTSSPRPQVVQPRVVPQSTSPGDAGTTPPQAPVAQQGPDQVIQPTAATTRTAQTARIRAQASGRYPVGKVLVLAQRPVKTSAGVTVRWRATTESRTRCTVRTVNGTSTAKLVRPGTCRVVGWAPAPSADYLPFTVQRTYRAVR